MEHKLFIHNVNKIQRTDGMRMMEEDDYDYSME